MTWRANYGSDVGSTYVSGLHEETNPPPPWRKPYGAGASAFSSATQQTSPDATKNNRASSEIDPLTGQPIVRNAIQSSYGAASMQGLSGTQQLQQQSEVKRQRQLVDGALEHNGVGIEGNLIAGGAGGFVGGRAVPSLMNWYTKNVILEPNATPSSFRERVTKVWRENYNPNSWNGPDLEFIGKQIHGENGLLQQMNDFNQPVQADLQWHSQRSTLFDPLTRVDTFADDVERAKAAERAITANQQAIAANGGQGKTLFSPDEINLLENLKEPKAAMPSGLQTSIAENSALKSLLEFKGDTFSKLSDTRIPIASSSDATLTRLSTARNAIDAHEQVVQLGQKGIFSADEMTALQGYRDSARSILQATEATTAGRFKSLINDFGPSIAKGVGVAGSLMVVDHYADQILFGKNHGNGIGDSINSALVPAAIMIGPQTSMLKMGLWGAGALIAGKLIGSSLSEGEEPSYSRYFKQSTGESFLLAAEALLPLKTAAGELVNWKRAALIAGTWLAFRGLNMVFDQGAPADTRDKAWELLGDDAKKRTDGSMTDAINKFGELGASEEAHGLLAWSNVFKEGMGKVKGARGEAALQVYRTEWLTKPTNEFGSLLEANRGAAILCTAFAESRLAHGTHVATITDVPTYLLEGMNLDMGGKAARDFIIARVNIDNAKKQVQENLGKEIAGKKVEESELAELDRVKQRIEDDEAKVYSKHDMQSAVKELAKWVEGLNAPHMAKLEVDLRNTIAANQNSSDDRYKAKLFRDLATMYLSTAYAKQESDPQSASRLLGGDTYSGSQATDITGQSRGYDGALDCIARAAELDRDNQDLAQLYQIAHVLNDKLPATIRKIMNDPKYNPS